MMETTPHFQVKLLHNLVLHLIVHWNG